MLYIKNSKVIDPVLDCVFDADVWIKDGKIERILRKADTANSVKERDTDNIARVEFSEEEVQVLDGTGMMLAPGLADVHVHFRDPGFTYKEDILTGAEAAKKGGFTEIVLMANTKPCVDNVETLSYVLEKGRRTGIHIYSCVNVTEGMKGCKLVDMESLAKAGAAGFTDDGVPIMDEELVKSAMEEAVRLNKPISFHEENPAYIENNGVHAGEAARHFGIGGSKREAEIDLIKRDLELALKTGATIVIQHISTKEGVELVREAKMKGCKVHAEATPHHFTLTQKAVIQKGTLAKMNPPLREEEDRQAILAGLKDGTIDLIATDHAPHSTEEKQKPITEAPSGIIGLETSLSLGIRELVMKGYLTYPQLIRRMSTTPCFLYGLSGGEIKEGAAANLVLFKPEETWEVEKFLSKSCNSPFVGEELPGVVYATVCEGKIVYQKI